MLDINKFFNVIKYICLYFIFISFSLVSKSQNNLYFIFNLLPNLDIIFMFALFFWCSDRIEFSKYNLFFFGLIIDTFRFLPLGLTSLTLLLVYKLMEISRNYFMVEDRFIYFLRDSAMFVVLFFVIQWFIFSLFKTNFFSFGYVFLSILKNIFFSSLLYLVYKKYFNYV